MEGKAAASTSLTLKQLQNELREVTTEWYSLGIELGIEHSELKRIEKSHGGDIDRCKIDTFDYWLRNSDDPSWEALAKALDKIGGHAHLVQALRTKLADPVSEGPKNESSRENEGSGSHEASYTSVSPDALHDIRPRSLSDQNGNIENVYDTCKADKPICLESESDLKVETTQMMLDFGVLVTAVQQALQDKGVTPEEFASHLQKVKAFEPVFANPDLPLLQGRITEVRAKKNLGDAFEAISGYYSWFNHRLIFNIIDALCANDSTVAQKRDRFLDQFRRYCENRISKVPKNGFGLGRKKDVAVIRFKVDEEWRSARVSQIAFILDTVATILKVKRQTIYLCSLNNGCVEIMLLVPKLVAETVFPLSHTKAVALGEMGVLQLQCGSYQFPKTSDRVIADATHESSLDLEDTHKFANTTSGYRRLEQTGNGDTHHKPTLALQDADRKSLEEESYMQYPQQSEYDAHTDLKGTNAKNDVLEQRLKEAEHTVETTMLAINDLLPFCRHESSASSSLAFRRLICNFSQKLSKEECQEIVYIRLYDCRERCRDASTLDILSRLEVFGIFSSDNPAGLIEVAKDISRPDLVNLVKDFMVKNPRSKYRKAKVKTSKPESSCFCPDLSDEEMTQLRATLEMTLSQASVLVQQVDILQRAIVSKERQTAAEANKEEGRAVKELAQCLKKVQEELEHPEPSSLQSSTSSEKVKFGGHGPQQTTYACIEEHKPIPKPRQIQRLLATNAGKPRTRKPLTMNTPTPVARHPSPKVTMENPLDNSGDYAILSPVINDNDAPTTTGTDDDSGYAEAEQWMQHTHHPPPLEDSEVHYYKSLRSQRKVIEDGDYEDLQHWTQ